MSKLREKKDRLLELSQLDEGQVSLERACEITGLSHWTLKDPGWCVKNKITQIRRQALRQGNNRFVTYSYIESELWTFAARSVQLPEGCMTVTQAANILKVSESCVRKLCKTGILDADWGEIPGSYGGRTIQHGWIPKRASVEDVAAFLRRQPDRYAAGRALRARIRDATAKSPSTSPVAPVAEVAPSAAMMTSATSSLSTPKMPDPAPYPTTDRDTHDRLDRIEALLRSPSCAAPATSAEDEVYVTATEAAHATAMTLSQLSKLCRAGGPVRYRRPGERRLEVHLPDLVRYLKQRDAEDE